MLKRSYLETIMTGYSVSDEKTHNEISSYYVYYNPLIGLTKVMGKIEGSNKVGWRNKFFIFDETSESPLHKTKESALEEFILKKPHKISKIGI